LEPLCDTVRDIAALEIGDASPTQAGSFGELLLRQTGGRAKLME
jgi:hypothetical protein